MKDFKIIKIFFFTFLFLLSNWNSVFAVDYEYYDCVRMTGSAANYCFTLPGHSDSEKNWVEVPLQICEEQNIPGDFPLTDCCCYKREIKPPSQDTINVDASNNCKYTKTNYSYECGNGSFVDNSVCDKLGLKKEWDGAFCCCLKAPTLDETPAKSTPLTFTPEVGIPGFLGKKEVGGFLLGDFLVALYKYLIGLSGIVVVIILILGAFEWVSAGGNQNKIGQAKERIKNAFIGMILLSCSYLILYTINPELINIKPIDIKNIKPVPLVDINKTEISGCSLGWSPKAQKTTALSSAVIAGIKKQTSMDPCALYAVIHQESGGQIGAFGNDADVANCDIYARRAFICNEYKQCCPQKSACEKCRDKVNNKKIHPPFDSSNFTEYLDDGYSFGIGLTQITFTNESTLCSDKKGFIYAGECVLFESLKTIDGNLNAFSRAWKKSYCPEGDNRLLCFKRMAGAPTSDWAVCTGGKKMILYEECKKRGFDNMASQRIDLIF
ncbi:MAG: pilin [Patescibacteria group bacterium]|nr:pilin [Patescibacteria group bacterium]